MNESREGRSNNNSIFLNNKLRMRKTAPCMGNSWKHHLNLKHNALYSPNKIPSLPWGWRGEQLSLCKLRASKMQLQYNGKITQYIVQNIHQKNKLGTIRFMSFELKWGTSKFGIGSNNHSTVMSAYQLKVTLGTSPLLFVQVHRSKLKCTST